MTRFGRAAAMASVAALGLALPAGAAAKRHRPARTCHPAHSKTLAATARVRVFQVRRVVQDAHVTYGCLLRRHRPVRFVLPDFPTGYAHVTIAGRRVAYVAYSDCAASFCDPNSVILQDLRTGRTTFADGAVSVATVSGIVLKADGSLAFLSTVFDLNGEALPGGPQLFAVAPGEAPALLDGGPGIAPGSLARAGSTLYWTKGGLPQSATLP
jgi:hypothetical protein